MNNNCNYEIVELLNALSIRSPLASEGIDKRQPDYSILSQKRGTPVKLILARCEQVRKRKS